MRSETSIYIVGVMMMGSLSDLPDKFVWVQGDKVTRATKCTCMSHMLIGPRDGYTVRRLTLTQYRHSLQLSSAKLLVNLGCLVH